MIRASSTRVSGATTIVCHLFLGAKNHVGATGTLTVDRGDAIDVTKRLASVATGGEFLPCFSVATEDDSDGAAIKSRIHVAGSDDATIFFST